MNIQISDVLIPMAIFAALGLAFGIILAVAAKIFEVKVDERVPAICDVLPGANCGGCGFSGCAALAEAIVKGEASPNACAVGGNECAKKIGEIMGVEVDETVPMRAQVMCAGCGDKAKRKYLYTGAQDCISASKTLGGDKLCPAGCLGFGTCAAACVFGAITVVDKVAHIDPQKCRACGLSRYRHIGCGAPYLRNRERGQDHRVESRQECTDIRLRRLRHKRDFLKNRRILRCGQKSTSTYAMYAFGLLFCPRLV